MAGGDITLPPVERPTVPEPLEKTNRDPKRRREDRSKKKKKPRDDDAEKPAEDGKGGQVDIRA